MAAATYHLNTHTQKLGKCIDKARPFYDVLREMRKVGKCRTFLEEFNMMSWFIALPVGAPFVIRNLLINTPMPITVIF